MLQDFRSCLLGDGEKGNLCSSTVVLHVMRWIDLYVQGGKLEVLLTI